jgi:hypothetical protein
MADITNQGINGEAQNSGSSFRISSDILYQIRSKLGYLKFGWPANFSDDEMEKMFLSCIWINVVDYTHS